MEGKNNLRVQIEQIFRDNPRKSYGVSEIARQCNARRNTVHYHLRTLKMRNFLCQNSEGFYYFDGMQEDHVANKEGITICRYHPHAPNVEWCPFCGNPICEKCLTNFPNGFIACQECKHKRMNSINKFHYSGYFVGSLLITILFLTLNSNIFVNILLIVLLIYLMVKESSWIKTSIKDRKEYFIWKRMVEDRPISDDIIRSLIQGKEMSVCKYHINSLGINYCEACGSSICAKCSRIMKASFSERLVCMKCFWKKRKHVLTFLVRFYLSGLIFYFVATITIILFSPLIQKNIELFFFVLFGLIPGLVCGIPLIMLSLFWIQSKKKYEIWSNEQMVLQIN